MTLQVKGFHWSIGIHGMLILAVAVLQALAVSQTKVTVIDFTLSGNDELSMVEQTSLHQASATKQASKFSRMIQPKNVLKKIAEEGIVKEVPAREIVKEFVEEQNAQIAKVEQARSSSKISDTAEVISASLPQTVIGPGGSSTEAKGSAIPSLRGDAGARVLSAERASRDVADTNGSIRDSTMHSGNADTVATPEASRATYLKEHFVYIRDRITGGISYPHIARKMGWCGQVKIAFVVCEDGSVGEVSVIESSGFGLLDRNAVETVKSVAPFPRPPVRAEIRMVITYRLS